MDEKECILERVDCFYADDCSVVMKLWLYDNVKHMLGMRIDIFP